jgi:hypothetical protein
MKLLLFLIPALLLSPEPVAARQAADFQQGVEYRIEARLDEATGVLTGRARMRYHNASPAVLDTLYVHLHLNAFRPNSAWARRELAFNNRRFQDLGPEDHAFDRLARVEVGGQVVRPVFPGAPDSTVVALPLPAPLRPGESTVVHFDWTSRLSTLPRRQGRRGRQYDFAHWYPRIAVYDRGGWQHQALMPQGEFYGEFATYDVTLEVPADQVLAATGVPVEGDPGWERALAEGEAAAPSYRRDAYEGRPEERLGLLAASAPRGQKRVRWVAERVIHFAWNASPDFLYEGGSWNDVAVHVLYPRGDTAWPRHALERTKVALEFFDTIFGPYPYPQVTNVHRIEPGGTEFPMLMMNGSPSQGLIVHELGHIYAHGILANNEWRDGWLDEGLVSFLTNWFWEEQGQDWRTLWERDLELMRVLERSGLTQPVATPGHEFIDFQTYAAMTYTKAALIFRMLRDLMGEDAFRAGLRRYFADNRFRHVDEESLRAALEAAHGAPLDWFFHQWLHTTATLDYRLTRGTTRQLDDGRWETTLIVQRDGDIWMPVVLEVGSHRQTLDSRERAITVTVVTDERPREAVLDPDEILIEIDVRNNRIRL